MPNKNLEFAEKSKVCHEWEWTELTSSLRAVWVCASPEGKSLEHSLAVTANTTIINRQPPHVGPFSSNQSCRGVQPQTDML